MRLGDGEQLKNTQRIIPKPQIFEQPDTATFDGEGIQIFGAEKIRPPKAQLFTKICFHHRTKNTGQIANMPDRQIIAFHKTFNSPQTSAISKSHAWCNRHLRIKIQTFFGATSMQMQMTPHRPQEPLG